MTIPNHWKTFAHSRPPNESLIIWRQPSLDMPSGWAVGIGYYMETDADAWDNDEHQWMLADDLHHLEVIK
jgi:hypothetical protein